MKKIIAGIIGFGIGKYHALNISKLKNSEVKYVCDFDVLKKKQINELFPNALYIENPSKIFNDKEVNLVVIASYDNYHYDHIIKSIQNNKNIFVEKPFCLTLKEFKKINRELKNKKISISSNLVLRTNSYFLNLKKRLKDFGNIYYRLWKDRLYYFFVPAHMLKILITRKILEYTVIS